MQKYRFLPGLMIVVCIASCAAAPQPGTPVTHETACNADNHDKRVSIAGYPMLSGLTLVDDDFSVDLFAEPQGGGESITVYFTVGTGANQAENLPEDYTDADLKIHTKDNQVVSTDKHIRVHGTLYWSEVADSDDVCFISPVDLIEAVE